jgi:hypothetical protein
MGEAVEEVLQLAGRGRLGQVDVEAGLASCGC